MNTNKLYWLVTIIFTVLMFFFFGALSPAKHNGNKIILSHEVTPDIVNLDGNIADTVLTIKLKAENSTDTLYSSDEYFYRIVVNRSYPDSPGFIIKEFSKVLEPKGHFEEEFTWKKKYLPNNEAFKFRVHFNMYKRNKGTEPIIIASDTKIFWQQPTEKYRPEN